MKLSSDFEWWTGNVSGHPVDEQPEAHNNLELSVQEEAMFDRETQGR